jgi:hypothetical protein
MEVCVLSTLHIYSAIHIYQTVKVSSKIMPAPKKCLMRNCVKDSDWYIEGRVNTKWTVKVGGGLLTDLSKGTGASFLSRHTPLSFLSCLVRPLNCLFARSPHPSFPSSINCTARRSLGFRGLPGLSGIGYQPGSVPEGYGAFQITIYHIWLRLGPAFLREAETGYAKGWVVRRVPKKKDIISLHKLANP